MPEMTDDEVLEALPKRHRKTCERLRATPAVPNDAFIPDVYRDLAAALQENAELKGRQVETEDDDNRKCYVPAGVEYPGKFSPHRDCSGNGHWRCSLCAKKEPNHA